MAGFSVQEFTELLSGPLASRMIRYVAVQALRSSQAGRERILGCAELLSRMNVDPWQVEAWIVEVLTEFKDLHVSELATGLKEAEYRARAAEVLAAQIKNTTNAHQVWSITLGFASLAESYPELARAVAPYVTDLWYKAGERDADLEEAVAMLAKWIPEERSVAVSNYASTRAIESQFCFGLALNGLSLNVRESNIRWFVEEALKWPNCSIYERRRIMGAIAKAGGFGASFFCVDPAPPCSPDEWRFADWAAREGFDIQRPPKLPPSMQGHITSQ